MESTVLSFFFILGTTKTLNNIFSKIKKKGHTGHFLSSSLVKKEYTRARGACASLRETQRERERDSMVVLENQREVRSVITRNQNGAIVGAKDVREKFGDVFATEIGPIVSALVSNDDGEKKKKKNTKELESLKNAIARDGGKLVADAKAYEMALNDLERGYAGVANEAYPFEEKMRDLMKRNRATAKEEVKMVEEKFEKMVANARGEDNGEGFIITDEHGNATTGDIGGSILNTKCPLTGIELKDLQEPVEDAVGIVYEKAQVLTFLGREGRKKCPEALRNHVVTKEELKVSEKVMRMKRMGQRTRETKVDENLCSP
tara:strand:- start:3328 stop:4281 length:954 start_codon:yes stop_codon:yes gene_type:complete